MKKILFLLILFVYGNVNGTIKYISPSGSDGAAGTIGAPKFSLNGIWSSLSAGDTLYLRGGTYTFTTQQYLTGKNGTAGNLIKVWAYPGETPIITRGVTFTKPNWHRSMVFLTANYTHWKGIKFTGMYTDDNQVDAGMLCWDVNNSIFELLEFYDNVGGMMMENSATGNLILNCDFHDNYSNYGGSNGGNSDGFQTLYMTSTSSTNTIRGCRSWNNGDDGFDTFENSGYVLIDSCWSWHNGYVYGTSTRAGNGTGFKMGSDFLTTPANVGVVQRRLQRSMAWDNGHPDESGGAAGAHINEADHSVEIYNCTFFRNGITGLNFHYNNRVHYFRNNISFANGSKQVEVSWASTNQTNSAGTGDNDGGWTVNVTNGDFVSIDTAGQRGARQADGTLPVRTFLTLAAGSDLIDAGTVISGIAYSGSLPDRGANEYSAGGNVSPSASAGVDQTITLPTSSVTLTGSGTDSDGSITAYAWTKISGTGGTIVSASSATTSVTGLTAGTYVFRLTVTDNGSATGTDDITITVNAAAGPSVDGFRLRGRRYIFRTN